LKDEAKTNECRGIEGEKLDMEKTPGGLVGWKERWSVVVGQQ